jgi:mono/diheme cytochrome c family protein/glucose/arabinose dehydrogenase
MKRVALTLAALLIAGASGLAQNGDVKGEEQPPLSDAWKLPAPKPLSPEQELATFHVDDGLRVELVACEPLVRDPVCATFDERGQLWVCEMSGFMPDVDGRGEDEASGSVVVLSDEDGDGRMDKRVVFMDHLVLPRAVAPTRGGALVIAPPNLYFARDTDGDGRADEQVIIDTGLQGIASPEHAINGLLYTLDNWFVCADAPVRYRFRDGKWERGRTAGGGQWGITEDRWGRIFLNDNSNPLRCDLYPSQYAVRNPNLGVAPGMNVNIAAGARPHPSHMTPGVNRGYRAGVLADGRLNEFTGACAPWIYEGDALPERYRGNAIVCEPCGNLLHRFEITYDEMGRPKADTAPPDGAFLTSTDERFRPVWLNEGPDGALYVVDMYRGVLQHRIFVTSWLRKQMEERELAQPLHSGRIWRVTSGRRKQPVYDLANCSWTELVNSFDSPNRWVRKTAQRLLVEQGLGERDALEVLRAYVFNKEKPPELGRLHALWAMTGLDAKSTDITGGAVELSATQSPAPFSARLFEAGFESRALEMRSEQLSSLLQNRPRAITWDVVLPLSESRSSNSLTILFNASVRFAEDEVVRGAIVSGLHDRELSFIGAAVEANNLQDDRIDEPGGSLSGGLPVAWFKMLEMLASCVVRDGRSESIDLLLNWFVATDIPLEWQLALARGVLNARSKDASGKSLPIRVAHRPDACEWFEQQHSPDATLAGVFNALIWPGKPGTEGMFPRELTEAEHTRFERGRGIFEQTCASCHQFGGRGDAGIAPPLRDSPWVLGDATRVTKVVLRGLRGPIKFGDLTWDGEMPGFTASDDDVAAILTYLRREWNHAADPVAPDFVRDVRKATADRKGPWSVSELSN